MSPVKGLRDIHSAQDDLQLPIVRAEREKGAKLTDEERARVMRGERWDGKAPSE